MAKDKKQRVYIGIVIDADLKVAIQEEACLTSRSLSGQVKFILRQWKQAQESGEANAHAQGK